jgi:hypothetical protein
MSKLMTALFVTAGLGIAGLATQRDATATETRPQVPNTQVQAASTYGAQAAAVPTYTAPMSKDAYEAAIKNAESQYKIDKEACASRSGNAKDICLAEASAREKVAKADAEAAFKNTPKAREDMRDARAEAAYSVAKEKCDHLAGNAKDVCLKEADAARVRARADAKVDRVVADTRQDAAARQAEASKEAMTAKRDAEYKVAIEKCDALAGSAKDACISNAKMRYGRS